MKSTVEIDLTPSASSGAYAGLRLAKRREQAKTPEAAPAPAASPKPKATTAPTRPAEPIMSPAAARADVRAAMAESQGLPTPGRSAVAVKPDAQTAREKEERAARIWDQAMNGKTNPLPGASPAAQAVWDKAIAKVFPTKGQ